MPRQSDGDRLLSVIERESISLLGVVVVVVEWMARVMERTWRRMAEGVVGLSHVVRHTLALLHLGNHAIELLHLVFAGIPTYTARRLSE